MVKTTNKPEKMTGLSTMTKLNERTARQKEVLWGKPTAVSTTATCSGTKAHVHMHAHMVSLSQQYNPKSDINIAFYIGQELWQMFFS